MIKIGDCYFARSQIAAIQPSGMEMSGTVYLVQGSAVSVKVRADDLPELLAEAGLLYHAPAVDPIVLSAGEHQSLWLAFEDGYRFAAKDRSGQVFAYKKMPYKGTSEWGCAADAGDDVRRLHGDFDFLLFEDNEPLDLDAFFSEDDPEEADE